MSVSRKRAILAANLYSWLSLIDSRVAVAVADLVYERRAPPAAL